jgi:hypothetical protein
MIFKIFTIALFFIGCGSSSSSKSTTISTDSTGYLVDAKVSGVEYYCDNIREGITGENNIAGSFTFNFDCNYIKFTIGSVTLAEMPISNVNTDKIFYITDIALRTNRNDTNNTSVTNIARLLQTLDEDSNPENGIVITKEVRDNITNTVHSNISSSNINENDLKAIIIDAGLNKELVSPIKALVHLEQTLRDNNISVDTVPSYKPYTANEVLAVANDTKYIYLYGEKNTRIFVNGIDTNKTINKYGEYKNFKLDTSIVKNNFSNFNITLYDGKYMSEELSLHIFKDTDDVSQYTQDTNITIQKLQSEVITINITDNSQNYGLTLDYELSGLNSSLFDINSSGSISFKKKSSVGTYNLTVTVKDKATHQRVINLIITVE